MLLDFIYRVLGREDYSRNQAKERLRLVLVHDRATISPYLMNKLKGDLLKVITDYMVIDEDGMDIHLDQSEREVALVANIPIKKIRRDYVERRETS